MSAKIRKQKPKSMLELMKTIEKVWFEDITAEYLALCMIPCPIGSNASSRPKVVLLNINKYII